MTKFYIVRHGNTELNKKNILMGQIDSPLTEEGYKDALFLAKKLKKIKFEAVFSSDLGRAFITAHIIADTNNLKNKIFRTKEFREINYGDLSLKKLDEVRSDYGIIKNDFNLTAPNGESHANVKRRVVKKLFNIAKKNYKTVLIVTHNNCIRSIISEALEEDFNLLLRKDISHRFIAEFDFEKNKIINFNIIN